MEILDKISEIGPIRKNNEDAVNYVNHPKNSKIKLFIVADGMGGKLYGEVASNYVVDEVSKWFVKKDLSVINDNDKCISLVKRLIKRINKKLITEYGENVLGTTLTMAIKNKKNTIIINVGDSRCYTYKDDNLLQITEDDSDVWFYHKYGEISKEDLRYFSTSNFINACVGLTDDLCKINKYIISNDYNMLLLLTDGVTDLITDKKLKKIIKKEESKDILKRIIHEALYVDQHLFIPFRLKKKYLSSYTVPYTGRDNASGVIYIKKEI